MQLTLWTYEGPPHVGAMRIATAMEGVHYVLHAPAGRHVCRPAVHDDPAAAQAPTGDLHHFPGARPGRRHGQPVQDRGARGLRALPAAGDDGRRELHRRADPGRPGWPGRGAEPADPGRGARAALLPAQGELGRGRDLLPHVPCAGRSPRRGRSTACRRPASPARRAATCSAPPPWASATATTCSRSARCCSVSASRSTSPRRWARRRPTWHAWATPTSTWCCTPRPR